MPGLEQLKRFSEDVAKLGNELIIREEKGEPIVQIPFPENISVEDDSDDFVLGMPLPFESEDDNSGDVNEDSKPEQDISPQTDNSQVDYSAFPELDSLLNPEPAASVDFADFPELNELLNPVEESSQVPEEEPTSLDDVPSGLETNIEPPVENIAETTGLDFDLPDFDNLDSSDPLSADTPAPEDNLDLGGDLPTEGLDLGGEESSLDGALVDSPSDSQVTDSEETSGSSDDFGFDVPDFDNLATGSEETSGSSDDFGFDLPDFDNLATDSEETSGASDDLGFDLPDFDNLDNSDSLSTDTDSLEGDLGLGGDLSTDGLDLGSEESSFDSSLADSPSDSLAEAQDEVSGTSDDFGFDLPDFDNLATDSEETSGASDDLDLPDFDNLDNSDSLSIDTDSLEGDLDLGGDLSTDGLDSMEAPSDTSLDDSISSLEGSESEEDRSALDFGSHEPIKVDPSIATKTVSEDDFPSAVTSSEEVEPVEDFVPEHHEIFDAPDDPFDGVEPPPDENFDDFDIPGFSDQAAGMVMAKTKRPSSVGKDGKKEKNTLTDKEYEAFIKNLRGYPLNLRIELEKFIVGDEFKDEVVFEVIQKVIKKISARQLATHLEKLLDISIPVPREFERRTVAQYEEYKKSAEYQLKNRILPIALISVMAACIMYFVFLFGKNFIYEPLKANSLYKEGYALLEEGAYPQSEMKFDEALTYQQQKRWFFTYAEGYRQHKQYERARMMYRAGLQRFKQDKELGLDYAEMELYDLRNFENAENVVRREVLDYHINDPDGMLLLGDIFLEWGDERDPTKYEEAKIVYNDLLQIYGQEDLYLARLMRYYIRVDDLRNVLQMKEYFYPKKKALNGQDLIELSGYLLEKISGNIAPADEYLLSSIEDVRELLERAVEAVPDEPESLYNMGLYFVNSNNITQAQAWLTAALTAFENAEYKPRKRLLRQLNTYRILGDLDMENKEYLSAEEKYRTGVSLFEKEEKAGLVGDENVGKLYASLADINYMIIGDYDEALRNYTIATNTQYETPSVYYKMGYINYSQKKYGEALNLFIDTAEKIPYDTHVLFALGNVLSIRGDNFAAQGYYQRLMNILEQQRVKYDILFPQVNDEHKEIVEMYKVGANNLGVTLYRLSRQTGNSTMNAEALTNFTASIRAYDALERDQETLVRKEGSNLAEQNIKYMTMSLPEFEPAIYTEIPALIEGEYLPK